MHARNLPPFDIKRNAAAPLRLSFCTAIQNRLHQFQQVFAHNCKAIAGHSDVEWIILDYNSTDGLQQYLSDHLPHALGSRIVFAKELSGRPWHASVAKNIAHKLGRGAILMNLDADNRIGAAIEQTRLFNTQSAAAVHHFSGVRYDGTFGRISIRADTFLTFGGYDEQFLPMGYQDRDLLMRIRAAGLHVLSAPCRSAAAIPNTKNESLANCDVGNATWTELNQANRARSERNLCAGRLVANEAQPWGVGEVVIIHQAETSH